MALLRTLPTNSHKQGLPCWRSLSFFLSFFLSVTTSFSAFTSPLLHATMRRNWSCSQEATLLVNLGTRSVHYPFLLRLPAGQLPKARGSFPDIDQVGDQLKLLFNQQELGKQQQRQGGGQQQKQGEQQQQQQPQQQQQQQQQGGQHEQRCQKVSALTPTERKATWTSPPAGQDHGDPAGPDKSQEGACGRAPTRASALAAGWLK